MKNDIDKLSFDEFDHYVGVFHQMGRVALPSDLNAQNELVLRLLQRLAGDAVHTGSPNEGFRVDTRLLVDRMDSRRGWVAQPATARLFVDYFNHRVGDGSLAVSGATQLRKTLDLPLDLTGLVDVVVAVNMPAGSPLTFTVGDGTTTHALTMSTLLAAPDWTLLRALPGVWPAALAVNRITEYGFTGLAAGTRYAVDAIHADLPLRTLFVDPEYTEGAAASGANAVLAADDDQRLWQRRSLRVDGASALTCTLAAPVDASRARALLVGLRRSAGAALPTVRLVDGATPAQSTVLAGATVFTQGGWEVHRFALAPGAGFGWSQVAQLELAGLSSGANDTYHLGPVLLEADPARDLVVMGGDGSAQGAGRFHGDGLAAVKEAHGTYFTQKDLPQADTAALAPVAESQHRIDWAYLDLWERPLSFAERPELRDVALGGQDTTTRTQLVAQVRLLAGNAVPLAQTPQGPEAAYAQLQPLGQGVLSTKDKPAAVLDPCADPCEPAIAGPYLGEDNRLFRVEIHRAGDIGAAAAPGTALFKWSRENAGTLTPLVADAAALATSVAVEAPELFAIDDLIEVSNDLVELITGDYEDRAARRAHRRGELRRITSINLDTRRIGWANPGPVDPLQAPFHAGLERPHRLAQHAKVTRWDGVAACGPGDIVLADGVVIEFGGQGFAPGDHWLFATRTADRSVERLIEAPPIGIRHAYYKLAAIHRSRGAAAAPEVVFCEDLRPRLAALSELEARRVAYDPGAGLDNPALPTWRDVGSVQEALDALAEAQLGNDMALHHKLLHGMGVICGLQMRCVPSNRRQVVIRGGYAIDCEGHLLRNRGDVAHDVVALAQAQGLLVAGKGKVNLWIERAGSGFAVRIERHQTQGFWDEVLEGSLLKDFFDKVVVPLVLFWQTQLQPFPDPTPPISDPHKRVITLLNLVWQLVNPTTGRHLWLSRAEHDLLAALYQDIKLLLSSQGGYCGMFDHLTPLPAYPYAPPEGITTMFGVAAFHRRLRMDAAGRWVATCGTGSKVQLFDRASGQAVLVEEFLPGGTGVQVQDVAFNGAGTRMHVVATLTHGPHVDSVFATATLGTGATPTLTWGPPQVVCDTHFVTLALVPARPAELWAVARHASDATRRGLYMFDPDAVPLTPSPRVAFNAVGHFAIDANGTDAVFTEHANPAVQNGSFDRLRRISLNSTATVLAPILVTGRPFYSPTSPVSPEDLALANGTVYVTAMVGADSKLRSFVYASGATAVPDFTLSPGLTLRLALLPNRNLLALCTADGCLAVLLDLAGGTYATRGLMPLQLYPMALVAAPDQRMLYALNMFSGTVNAIDVSVIRSSPAPSYTLLPPTSLMLYRADMLKAFTDFAGVLVQYLKDGFFDQFLVNCPECGPDDKVYLGVIEIDANQVQHICNFSKRHYAKSFRTWGYWLSALPLLPMLKTALKRLACIKLVP